MTQPRTRNGKFIARGNIPGANGCEPPREDFEQCGVVWTKEDARKVGGAPIGLALAMEWRDADQAAAAEAVA